MVMEQYKDELKVYRGDDYIISDSIRIHQPTLNEICEYGEHEYYSMVYQLTATPQTLKWQLWDMMHIDYTTITPYQLFCGVLHNIYTQEQTSILFGGLDLQKYEMAEDENGKTFLYQKIQKRTSLASTCSQNIFRRFFNGIKNIIRNVCHRQETLQYTNSLIDEETYHKMVDYLRQAHGILKDEKMPANESTKMILIEDARDEFQMAQAKEWHSNLKNMVSAMINSPGFKYSHTQVWDMKINAFMDSVKRISKIKNADLLLQSGYSGFGINLKDISDKQLDWIGELE